MQRDQTQGAYQRNRKNGDPCGFIGSVCHDIAEEQWGDTFSYAAGEFIKAHKATLVAGGSDRGEKNTRIGGKKDFARRPDERSQAEDY